MTTWNDIRRSTEEEFQQFRKALNHLFFTKDEFIREGPSIIFKKHNEAMQMMGYNEMIDKPYAYHKPSSEGLDKINRLREHFSKGERLIREICVDHEGKPTRQQSVAITNNETTAMWAIKAVVFNDPNSVVEDQKPDSNK